MFETVEINLLMVTMLHRGCHPTKQLPVASVATARKCWTDSAASKNQQAIPSIPGGSDRSRDESARNSWRGVAIAWESLYRFIFSFQNV